MDFVEGDFPEIFNLLAVPIFIFLVIFHLSFEAEHVQLVANTFHFLDHVEEFIEFQVFSYTY